MTGTPIFDALAAELLTAGTEPDEPAEVESRPGDRTDVDVRLNGRLE
jgi:hypothetical protein